MSDNFLTDLSTLKFFKELTSNIDKIKNESNKVLTSSISGSAKTILISIYSKKENQILVLLPTRQLVNELNVELTILGIEDKAIVIDSLEVETIQEKLTSIKNKDSVIIISTFDLLKVKLPSKEEIDKNTTKLEVGSDITYDDLVEYMSSINYNNEKIVGDPGCFAVRGSIIDFWSFSEEHPCRLEFDGDFLESIRFFDPESQRSSNRVESVTIASSIEESGDTLYRQYF